MTHAPIPDAGNPVKRRHEQPEHHAPHTAHAVRERGASDVDRVTRACPGSEGGKRLQEFAEAPPAHEEVLLDFDSSRGVDSDGNEYQKVADQNAVIQCGHERALRVVTEGKSQIDYRDRNDLSAMGQGLDHS